MTRATSIISTSGAGASLEARVAGTYLSAMLAQSSGPGDDPSGVLVAIDFQRTDPAAGFDDLHLRIGLPTGGAAKVYLQIKRTLTGDRSREPFRRPVRDAATLLRAGHADAAFRIVASESAISPRDVDRARDAARLSAGASDFWARWLSPGQSSDSEREYTAAVGWVIEQDLGGADPDLAFQVIARMGLAVLDVDQSGSQSAARAVDLLQGALPSGDRAEAAQLFETLCQFAEDAAKVAGSVDRGKLLGELVPRYRLTAAPSARACVGRVAAEADAALASIRDDIAGIRLPRTEVVERLTAVRRASRGVRLGGAAGTGKSAVLRRVAEVERAAGAGLIVLKHDRLSASTWVGYAQLLQVATPLARLIDELAAGGSGLLVLDGFDRMVEAGYGDLVREVCGAIEGSATAASWRCVVSSRDAAGPEPPLDMPLLREASRHAVGAPDAGDLELLADAFPHLAPLIQRRGYGELNRNLFFLDQMARNPSDAGASSELDLMRAWAGRGGSETPRHRSRDATLRTLGEQRLARPYGPLTRTGDDDALARLASERTLDIPAYRDVVTFTHDIYEDWAVARALDARRVEVPAILLAAGQPLAWMRAIRLVAEVALEADGPAGWLAFHDLLANDRSLDPLWRRLSLTAMLHSPRAANLLDALEPMLLEGGARLMADLLETLLTIEVQPHPMVLTAPQFEHLDGSERRRIAQNAAVPRMTPWHAFLSWSVGRWAGWPKVLVPVLTRVVETWLRLPGRGREPTGLMVAQCVAWLRELDAIHAMPFGDWEERSRRLAEMSAERGGTADRARSQLRYAIAMGAAAAVGEVDSYLADLIGSGGRDGAGFVEAPGAIPSVLPSRFVDLVVCTMVVRHDPDGHMGYGLERSSGIRDQGRFFPASPTRAGLDLLFAADEDQALRLLDALSAAAADAWRRREEGRGRTALPISLVMGSASVTLWGDQHVFKWSSGLLGPHLLRSLFLAADAWMAQQLAEGRTVFDLCAKLLGSSHLVASVSLCLAAATDRATSPGVLQAALPLISQPRIMRYGLRLWLADRSGSAFEIGWRPGDRHAYQASNALRERRVRRPAPVMGLIAPLHLSRDASLRDSFRVAVEACRVEDLAEFEEQLEDDDACEELEGELESWRAQADASNWHVTPGPDDRTFSFGYTPPGSLGARAAEARVRHEELEDTGLLMEWAFGAGRDGVTPRGQTFEGALPFAKAMDEPELFQHALDIDPAYSMRSQGIAAVAAAVATHGEPDLVRAEMPWLLSVFHRAAAIDHWSSPFHCEETMLTDDPAASAGRGLGALAMRRLADGQATRTRLCLVASPFRDIAMASLEPAVAFAAGRPAACAAALSVSADSMLYAWEPFGVDFERRMRTSRAGRTEAAIDRALSDIDRDEFCSLAFPRPVTEPFVGGDASNPCAGDPGHQFDTYRAAAVWGTLGVKALSEHAGLRDLLLGYLSGGVRWYASFLEFQEAERRHGAPARRMDWESTLGRMAGQLAYVVPSDVAIQQLVAPAALIGVTEARSDVLAHLLGALGRMIVTSERAVDSGLEAIWRAASGPLFEAARRHGGARHDPDATPLLAAAFSPHGIPVFPREWPRAGELHSLLTEWVDNCRQYRFAASAVRALVDQAGQAFVPSPGLDWLEAVIDAHGSTGSQRWRSSMGRAAGETLVLLWDRSAHRERQRDVARFRAAAGRLADRGVSSAADLLAQIAVVQAGA